nr:reverse transcriptase domain-containing protein [Tanacetum cinerariifolium]
MVSYTSISSLERSWDIPDIDLYEEAILQAIEQVAPPLSPAYLPDPIELDEHVPMYVLEPEYSESLELPTNDIIAEDQPHADDAEPLEGSDDTEPPEEDETSVTPPPSRLRGARISICPQTPMLPLFEARVAELLDMPTPPPSPLTLILCFATPTTGFVVGESSAAAARPPKDLYGFVDTTEAKVSITHRHARTIHDTERRMMIVFELVNLRVFYEAQTRQRNGKEFHSQLRDAQRDHAGIRAEIVALRDRGTLLEDAYIELHEDLEGVVSLSCWYEKMESVFYISGYAVENQVKFTTYTMLDVALTWWNAHVRGNDVAAYAQRFQELALMCTKFLVDETEKVNKYISELSDNIHGNVMSARPKTLDETIELANDLIDQKLHTYTERQNDNKRKADDSLRNNQQ